MDLELVESAAIVMGAFMMVVAWLVVLSGVEAVVVRVMRRRG